MKTLMSLLLLAVLSGCEAVPRQVLPYVMADAGAAAGGLDLHLYDLEMGQSRRLLQTPGADEYDPDIDPAGKRVAYIARQTAGDPAHALRIYDLETGEVSELLRSPGRLFQPVWSNDGEQIAYVVEEDGRWLVKVLGRTADKPTRTIAFGSDPSWRIDDRAIFYSSRETLDIAAGDLTVHELKAGLNQSLALRGNGFRNLSRGTSVVYTALPYSRRNEAVWLIDANSRQTRLSSPGKAHRDLDPVHINGTKFVAFTRIDVASKQSAIYVVERYATDPVETLLFEAAGNAYTRGGQPLFGGGNRPKK